MRIVIIYVLGPSSFIMALSAIHRPSPTIWGLLWHRAKDLSVSLRFDLKKKKKKMRKKKGWRKEASSNESVVFWGSLVSEQISVTSLSKVINHPRECQGVV